MIWAVLFLVAGLAVVWWWVASRRMVQVSQGPTVPPRPGRALLLVDLQAGSWNAARYDEATRSRIEAAVAREVAVAQDRGFPVIALKHEVAAPVARLIAPRASSGPLAVPFQGMADHVIRHWAEDGFETGELDNLLDVLRVGHLRIMGQDGAHSLARTAQAALDRGVEVELVRDGIACTDKPRCEGAIEALIGQGVRRV
ncbi:cysteine hydrolase [Roseovarius sp. A21]|uniref:Cysteine hydrolase n=1 Tax=Roseovarius bejariae TaxID=2576383 RepID=A0A844CHN0_9RHOB|nr:isochorismatase family protein [Roseovarius bejariae]MRU14821.1 cysteine hydrolase [Roseovarius bejariae]